MYDLHFFKNKLLIHSLIHSYRIGTDTSIGINTGVQYPICTDKIGANITTPIPVVYVYIHNLVKFVFVLQGNF